MIPPVAVIMPVLNEEQHLAEAVAAITGQDYRGRPADRAGARPVDGRHRRGSPRQLQAEDPRILLVPNPTGRTPAGLNAALAATTHPIVVRVDGHALLPKDYISTAVEVLLRTGAVNVGRCHGRRRGSRTSSGRWPARCAHPSAWVRRPSTPADRRGRLSRCISERFGVRRSTEVGGYDEAYVRAQDWEMNHRMRRVRWSDLVHPRMEVTYRPRSTVKAPWPASTCNTGAGAARSCASTRRPSACATSRRRQQWRSPVLGSCKQRPTRRSVDWPAWKHAWLGAGAGGGRMLTAVTAGGLDDQPRRAGGRSGLGCRWRWPPCT
jgi:hypothetical protein